MEFNFYRQSPASDNNHHSYQQKTSWYFTDLNSFLKNQVKSSPANRFSLAEMKKGSWVQIVSIPRHKEFPIVGVAVGTYMLVLGKTDGGGVKVQAIGKKATLDRAIAQQVYVKPFDFCY